MCFSLIVVISLGMYAVILAYHRIVPSWTIVFLPLLILLTLIATLSFGIMISALTVFYRDFKHIVPFMIQIFMFVTPVIYSANVFINSSSDDSVAEPDVRNHFGVPLCHPRYASGISCLWRSPRQLPWHCSLAPCTISAGRSGTSLTLHDLKLAGLTATGRSAGESITKNEPTDHYLRQDKQELSPGSQEEDRPLFAARATHCATLSAIRFTRSLSTSKVPDKVIVGKRNCSGRYGMLALRFSRARLSGSSAATARANRLC